MEKSTTIPLADAKQELRRISQFLTEPHLLIGGLAVQQYVLHRNSVDIDLVCSSDTAREITKKLYPSMTWNVEDKNQDEYRPSFIISPIATKKEMGRIYFGPKILQRQPYDHIDWDVIAEDAQPFNLQNAPLNNILVPRPEALAFTKLISFIGRNRKHEEKRLQDLEDFVELSNYKDFQFKTFYGFIYKGEVNLAIRRDFSIENEKQRNIVSRSLLFSIFNDLFDRPEPRSKPQPASGDARPLVELADDSDDPEAPMLASEIAEITRRYEVRDFGNSRISDLLIVVNIQNDFMPGGSMPVPGAETLVSPLNSFIKRAKHGGMQIVYTRDWHPEDHYSFARWSPHCVKGTKGASFPTDLEVPPDCPIIDIGTRDDADGYSPFADPKLQSMVADPGIRTIYVCGVALEFCVLATCRDAAWYGKTVVALEPYIRADQRNRKDVEFFWQIVGSFGVIRAQNAPF
jgi:nicotinamidase/pyrazinamidase